MDELDVCAPRSPVETVADVPVESLPGSCWRRAPAFGIIGFLGFFVKLVHIPIYQMIASYFLLFAPGHSVDYGWRGGARGVAQRRPNSSCGWRTRVFCVRIVDYGYFIVKQILCMRRCDEASRVEVCLVFARVLNEHASRGPCRESDIVRSALRTGSQIS